MIDRDLETLKDVNEWLQDDGITSKDKVEGIASMLFNELSEDAQMEILYDAGDDFNFYLKVIKNIDFDGYDGDCIRDMHELITDIFINHQTLMSDKMIKQHKYMEKII